MAIDPRTEIWNAAFETKYDAYFSELVEETLMKNWLKLDHASRVLAGLTATGSAITGWALWKDPSLTWLWPILTGISAALSILTECLGVKGKLRESSNSMRAFSSLRIELETFAYRMKIDPQFSVTSFQKELLAFRDRYTQECKRTKDDILRTNSMQVKCQKNLDQRLGY
ncbi:hypothetical protein [Herbaspirillum sp. RV1423]|uniref:hypothetical protein n=1 Tax=Herbaspirillum sp. RV1423 TaxID=1443993 RepID=UPI000551691D|nr:hypothetical protein [Herbaspirillum sp. RV1423]